jgi:hypothetical protein
MQVDVWIWGGSSSWQRSAGSSAACVQRDGDACSALQALKRTSLFHVSLSSADSCVLGA